MQRRRIEQTGIAYSKHCSTYNEIPTGKPWQKPAFCAILTINVVSFRSIPKTFQGVAMKTSQSNERLLALCALIAEEKDPDRFTLLVHELSSLLNDRTLSIEQEQSRIALRGAKVSDISPQA
jgi:hypothetical protein